MVQDALPGRDAQGDKGLHMLTFESFTGINNTQPAHRLQGSDLLVATDVDIGLTGEITRRAGFTQVSADCHKNLHAGPGYMLATVHSDLTAIHRDGSRHIVAESLGMGRVWYCDLPDGRTTFTNGLIHGITDGLTGKAWAVPAPDTLGTLTQVPGRLHPGAYTYHLAYRRADGLEGPAASSAATQVSTGGIYLAGLPVLEGHTINVYLSGRNGEGAYLAGATASDEFVFSGLNHELVLPCRTLGALPFPVGTITGFWRGRVLVAQGDVLWASRAMAPHLADWRDFKPMGATITAVLPVEDGIYVGTTQDLVFLAGTTWDQLAYRSTQRGPVVLGSGVLAPGDRLKLGDGAGGGKAMLCIAGGDIVAGFAGGQTASLTGDRYKSTATEVCATFREVNGIPQYMAIPQ